MRYNCFKASSKDSAAAKPTRFDDFIQGTPVVCMNIEENKNKNKNKKKIPSYRKGDQETQT